MREVTAGEPSLSQGLRDAAQAPGEVGVRQVSEVTALAGPMKELKSTHILAPGRDVEADVGHHPVGARTGRAPVNDAGVFDDGALYVAFGDTRRDAEHVLRLGVDEIGVEIAGRGFERPGFW